MTPKQQIISDIQTALDTGFVTVDDLRELEAAPSPSRRPTAGLKSQPVDTKLNAVDVMFSIAGVILFGAIMATLAQSWEDLGGLGRIACSGGVGVLLWVVAYYLLGLANRTDIRRGLARSLLLTGSLLLIVGGYIAVNEVTGGYGRINFTAAGVALLIVGFIHIAFDWKLRERVLLLIGLLLVVASFPAVLFGVLSELNASADLWALVLIGSVAILVYAARLISRLYPNRPGIARAYDAVATFIALASMLVATGGNYDVIWHAILIGSVLGIFYLSIVLQNKDLLGNASLFLVLAIISIALRYFSAYGVAFSLIVAAGGLLSTAAVAAHINRKYFAVSNPDN